MYICKCSVPLFRKTQSEEIVQEPIVARVTKATRFTVSSLRDKQTFQQTCVQL